MGKALDRYQLARPGKGWTTDKIIKLAKEMQAEGADLSKYAYGLTMLGTGLDQGYEVSSLLAALIREEAERKGTKVSTDTTMR